jgi:nuclease S1
MPRGTVASAGPANACLLDKIDQFIVELRDASIAKPEKILALKFLLHLIGDLHQPLHTANNKDRGGNELPVLYGDRTTPDNLHSYWDNHLVQRLGNDPRAVGASLNQQITKAKADEWSKGTPTDWAKESFRQGKMLFMISRDCSNFSTITAPRGHASTPSMTIARCRSCTSNYPEPASGWPPF